MDPRSPLPIDDSWLDADHYVESLLNFVSTSTLFQNLCGGVHVLDFLTRKPGLYETILPREWREWFRTVEIEDILELLLREDLGQFEEDGEEQWKNHLRPPRSLVEYIRMVRRHSLIRDLRENSPDQKLPRHLAVGMKPKKIHEVTRFATFVDNLSQTVDNGYGSGQNGVTAMVKDQNHESPVIIDFGSGQNYLGRTLTCSPYGKQVIAIEQRHHNVEGAKSMDVHAKLVDKKKHIINKKDVKRRWEEKKKQSRLSDPPKSDVSLDRNVPDIDWNEIDRVLPPLTPDQKDARKIMLSVQNDLQVEQLISGVSSQYEDTSGETSIPATPTLMEQHSFADISNIAPVSTSKIQYVEKELSDGNLEDILFSNRQPAMVVSIHSCGNLTHHGLRSITLNPSVKAVAMIGCCYNLLSERLGPPTYKLPSLRSRHPRLEETGSTYDPHGFPMSKRLEQHKYQVKNGNTTSTGSGIRLNITARMMAVQAPHNWQRKDCEEFFTKHYYRALLQRILLDLDIVKMSSPECTSNIEYAGGSLSGKDDAGAPLIIGTLRKSCFKSFPAYVKGAIEKLSQDPIEGESIRTKTRPLFEEEGRLIHEYEESYQYARKELSVIWSLMAFSANVVESTIIVDRWLWLMEQDVVEEAWVQAVFDYRLSPRNMVVVGVKRRGTV